MSFLQIFSSRFTFKQATVRALKIHISMPFIKVITDKYLIAVYAQ